MATSSTPTTNHLGRPTFAPLPHASQNSSAFQSYSSFSTLGAPTPASSAPLPSPSATQHQHQESFFGAMGNPQQQQAQSQQQQQQQQQSQPQQSHNAYAYQPNRQGAGSTAAETTNFLSQTALLAEAAKRAQMAVMCRDLDDFSM